MKSQSIRSLACVATSLFCLLSAGPAVAEDQLLIKVVTTDIAGEKIIVRGKNLINGPTLVVRLGKSKLSVMSAESHVIKAKLPDDIKYRDYQLMIRTGNKQHQFDTFDVTVLPDATRKFSQIIGYYTATQDSTVLQPGEFGGVRSICDPGDYAVSGSIVTRVVNASHGTNSPAFNFRLISSGLVIDGATGEQSWVLQGVNESPAPLGADIRVAARCADVLD